MVLVYRHYVSILLEGAGPATCVLRHYIVSIVHLSLIVLDIALIERGLSFLHLQ
jgi:hypothetical protein